MTYRSSSLLSASLAAVIFLTGCVTASVTRLDNTKREPIDPSQVTIYLEEKDVPAEYEKMAVIDLSAMSGMKEKKIYEKAREKAAEMGANGILHQSVEEAGTGERIASALFGTGSDTDAKMVAIYVPGEASGTSP